MVEMEIIVAVSGKKQAIGKDNKLLFHLKEDMKRFKELTVGNVVLMGRKTLESFPNGPLKDRVNLVLTRGVSSSFREESPELVYCRSLSDALSYYKERFHTDDYPLGFEKNRKLFVIGGENVYRQTIDMATAIHLTYIDKEVDDADSFFPSINKEQFLLHDVEKFKDFEIQHWYRKWKNHLFS